MNKEIDKIKREINVVKTINSQLAYKTIKLNTIEKSIESLCNDIKIVISNGDSIYTKEHYLILLKRILKGLENEKI